MKGCTELTKDEVIAIDGKTVRGSYDDSRSLCAIHMVNALRPKMAPVLDNIKFIENLTRSPISQSYSNWLIYRAIW